MRWKYKLSQYDIIYYTFESKMEYIKNEISLIDPRNSVLLNSKILTRIKSLVNEINEPIKKWKLKDSISKSKKIAILERLTLCSDIIKGQIETSQVNRIYQFSLEIEKIWNDFRMPYAQ